MLVRTETVYNTDYLLVICELGIFRGEIYKGMWSKIARGEPEEIDEYFYYQIDKEIILKYCKK